MPLRKSPKYFLILIIILVILAIGIIVFLDLRRNSTLFTSQTRCEQSTVKKCFLFKGLCQVGVAQNQSEAEANEKFLRDCTRKIDTWLPVGEE